MIKWLVLSAIFTVLFLGTVKMVNDDYSDWSNKDDWN